MNPASPRATTIALLVGLLCLIWSSTWLVIRYGLQDLPPLGAAAIRFLLAGALLALLCRLLHGNQRPNAPRFWLSLTMGTLNVAVSYGVVYYCETRLTSGVTAVLWAVYPVMMASLGHLFLAEPLDRRQATGFLVAFLGTVTMFCGDLGGAQDALGFALLLLLSPLSCAVSTAIVKRHGGDSSSLLLTRDGLFLGGLLLLLAAAWFEHDRPFVLGLRAWLSTLYLAVVGSALAVSVYFWLLRHTRASRLSLISYVTPPLALTIGWLAGDDQIDVLTLAGTALIVAGVAMVVDRRAMRLPTHRRPPTPDAEGPAVGEATT